MLSILIKPVSSTCNMDCTYCFYNGTCEKREVKSYGEMSLETLENIVKKAFSYAKKGVVFAFQGGEPTLRGLEFYKEFIKLQKKYNKKKIMVNNTIQTNGFNIDEEFVEFLAKEKFLVGLSIDGPKEIHNKYRGDSFNKVMKTKELFDKHKLQYNVLTVITKNTANNAEKLYKFYKENNIMFTQLIPALDKGFKQTGTEEYSLKPNDYEKFLKEFFNVWYKDYKKGQPISVRLFENICAMMLGMEPESCENRGMCSIQNVIESNGDIYPCDFYVKDDTRLGNINEVSFTDIPKLNRAVRFVEVKEPLDKCKRCQYGGLCRGGCKRYRDEETNEYYYCTTFKNFYDYSADKFIGICKDIVKRQKK